VATIYVRAVPGDLDDWLANQASHLGMSKAALVRLILMSAKDDPKAALVLLQRATKKGNDNGGLRERAEGRGAAAAPRP
jgi:hypothetical protein